VLKNLKSFAAKGVLLDIEVKICLESGLVTISLKLSSLNYKVCFWEIVKCKKKEIGLFMNAIVVYVAFCKL